MIYILERNTYFSSFVDTLFYLPTNRISPCTVTIICYYIENIICSPERFSIYFFYYITIFFVIFEGMFVLIKLFSSESYLNLFSFKDNSISFGNAFGNYRKFMYPLDSIIINIPFLIRINSIAIGYFVLIIYKNNITYE